MVFRNVQPPKSKVKNRHTMSFTQCCKRWTLDEPALFLFQRPFTNMLPTFISYTTKFNLMARKYTDSITLGLAPPLKYSQSEQLLTLNWGMLRKLTCSCNGGNDYLLSYLNDSGRHLFSVSSNNCQLEYSGSFNSS